MTTERTVHFHLEPELRRSAVAGQHNFISKMVSVLEGAGFEVAFPKKPQPKARVYSLSHMVAPPDERGLVFRRVYHYPFWQIDPFPNRWHWQVAGLSFDLSKVPQAEAQKFYAFWQKRLFEDAPTQTQPKGYIYAPLQGRLTRARAFQKCSPVEMLEHCLTHDPDRKVIATLHPKESYTRAELSALQALAAQHPRLTVEKGAMIPHLRDCYYIVTQNSSAAFNGAFFGKAALLFAGVDFHHMTVPADMDDLPGSFAKVGTHTAPYAAYLWWFWQQQSINAGREDAEQKITAKLRAFGWPID
jgi:hypothetical protein